MNTIFISNLKKWIGLLLLLCTMFQIVFYFSIANIFACIMILISWVFYNEVSFKYDYFIRFPISSFLIFGFVISQYVFALLFTTFDLNPLTNNLEVPYLVFIHSLLSLIVIVIAQLFYISEGERSPGAHKITKLLFKADFFTIPSDTQLWLMGALGLVSMLFIYFILPSAGREASGAIQKLIQGFIPFTYAPYLIFFKNNDKIDISNKNVLLFKIIGFTILLFVVAIGRNSRGAFMFGFTSLAFLYLFGLLLGIYSPKIFSKKNILLFFIGLWFITGPISDLATAMVIVRGGRNDVTRTELLYKTLEVYNDKEQIRNRELLDLNSDSDWDENYIDNKFLSRFCNLKYNDSSLELANKIGSYNSLYLNYEFNSILSTFPSPVIELLGINVDKKTTNGMSHGDYLYFISGAGSEVLGGFRVGHFSGIGMVAFGWFYLPILGLICIPLFYLLDSLALTYKNKNTEKNKIIISYAIIIPITSVFMFFPQESLIMIVTYLIRGWLQWVLLYWFIFKLTSFKIMFKNQ